ncbi:hypothetical protein [Streptomyces mirabilis]|uniref:hypothetical protein n=1 Tax=Streptomyces mirabilis TaxID=68239 RepID=UPI0029306B5D|nr:hypothetical protein [Streptomyces mirabilis]
MPILVDHSTDPVVPAYVETGHSFGIGDRFGDRAQGRRLAHRLVGPVRMVMPLELAWRVAQVPLVPDQRAVQEFVAAGLHPTLRQGVHPRHADPGEHDVDTRVAQERVLGTGPGTSPLPLLAISFFRPSTKRDWRATGAQHWCRTAHRSADIGRLLGDVT